MQAAIPDASLQQQGASSGTIVAGMLSKWVNLGKGWRPRLFVLKDGVLSYYRVAGPGLSKVNLHQIFNILRSEGDLQIIGAQTGVLEDKARRAGGSAQIATEILRSAQAEVHLQVADLETSQEDHCKLYIYTNVNSIVYKIKTETTDDRRAWMAALHSAKGIWERYPPGVASVLTSPQSRLSVTKAHDAELARMVSTAQTTLMQLGASGEIVAFVERLLREQAAFAEQSVAREVCQRRQLQDYIMQLENERRQLETQVVVESQIGHETGSSPNGTRRLDADSQSSGAAEYISDEDSNDGDHFYECSPMLEQSDSVESHEPVHRTSSVTEDDWIKAEGAAPHRREALPKPLQAERSTSLWSILKEVVGKDLTKVCLPVYFNEPLSALQKIGEELEYSELLDKAITLPAGSTERLLYIAAFAVSGYSGTAGRASKPFNPLLGETYEMVCQEKGIRLLAEKVVHHPTIIAGCCQGRAWTLDADSDLRSKFWGRSIELNPIGTVRLRTNDGEEYTWQKVTTTIGNLILGKIYIDHGGIMKVRNVTTNMTAKMNFKESGSLLRSKEQHVVQGTLEQDGRQLPKPTVTGKWDSHLTASLENGETLELWRKNPPPSDPTRYKLTAWAIKLNEITPGLEKRLAPTDCRLRPDQRATEIGDYDQANAQKQRLETKQRATRAAADAGELMKPKWFTAKGTRMGEGIVYEYSGGYWEKRAAGDWSGCRDIFGE